MNSVVLALHSTNGFLSWPDYGFFWESVMLRSFLDTHTLGSLCP